MSTGCYMETNLTISFILKKEKKRNSKGRFRKAKVHDEQVRSEYSYSCGLFA